MQQIAKTAQVSPSLYLSNLQYRLAYAEFVSAPANANNENSRQGLTGAGGRPV